MKESDMKNGELKMTLKECVDFIADYFKGDYEKMLIWFDADNIALGGVSPMWMIKVGRTEKLIKFIENIKEENHP